MKKHFTSPFLYIAIVLFALVAPGAVLDVGAATVDVFEKSCQEVNGTGATELCSGDDAKLFGQNSFWTRIVNTMIFVTAALSVVMIVIGGFRYSVSGGDQSAITSAKNTILYSVIGLIVAIVAYAIVNFVITEVLGQ